MAEAKVGADQLVSAGAPPQVAAKLRALEGTVGVPWLRLLALIRKDYATVQAVVQAVADAVQSGNWIGLLNVVQTRGPEVWEVVQDVIDLFQASAPPAFEAGVSER
jgi:hypothetical protein